MKLLILHLSDIHFHSDSNTIADKGLLIAAALQGLLSQSSGCIIAVTGDIAQSGKKDEYIQAETFFKDLHGALKNRAPECKFAFAAVPGNHDCDFSNETGLRKMILDSAPSRHDALSSADPATVEACVSIQDQFFEFLSRLRGDTKLSGNKRICHAYTEAFSGKTVLIHLYNTAWLSRLHEKQGSLQIPQSLFSTHVDSDLTLSLFHHPYNWLDADNANGFKKHVERTSDLVLTGHEHSSSIYEKHALSGETPRYTEGAILQGEQIFSSGFNAFLIAMNTRKEKRFQFSWNKQRELYSTENESEWTDVHRAIEYRTRTFDNTTSFSEYLSDAGTGFTHPSARVLKLRDLFVYPDVDDKPWEKSRHTLTGTIVHGEMLPEHIFKHKHVFIIGSERSGKTTLAKVLYQDLQQKEQVPILLAGEEINNHTESDLWKAVEKAFIEQYGSDSLEQFRQLAPMSRVLIIDDLKQAKLNAKGRRSILIAAKSKFSHVIVFESDLFLFEEATHGDQESPLLSFRHCLLREFGHHLRGKLIEKWLRIGQEYTTDNNEIEHQVTEAENSINTLLGKNLIPSQPLFILSILQLREAQTSLNTASGAYGYVYEILITTALSGHAQDFTLDTKYTYISSIAFRLFSTNKKTLHDDEIADITDDYFKRYKLRLDRSVMMKSLEEAHVLERIGSGVRFKYKYGYYYFVAKFIQENLASSEWRPTLLLSIDEMTNKVYNEDYANILIFFIYLTKNTDVMLKMLSNARSLYVDYEPCNLEKDVSLISERREAPAFVLEDRARSQAREEHRQELDAANAANELRGGEEQSSESQVEIEEVIKLNVAFKTIQIMGQIVRNFPGSLDGQIKYDIIKESYLLGLRTLSAVLDFMEQAKGEISYFLRHFLMSTKHYVEGEELDRRVDGLWFFLNTYMAHSLIKRTSLAVGSKYLKESYREVLLGQETVAMKLIDVSIKLDHFRPIPDEDVISLHEQVGQRNLFASSILKRLVINHLSLHHCDYRVKQRLCDRLSISASNPKFFPSRLKKS